MIGARKPKTAKSYHSNTLPTAPAICVLTRDIMSSSVFYRRPSDGYQRFPDQYPIADSTDKRLG